MWHEAYASVCRRHPDLTAVYESSGGTLALLLSHPLVPAPEERGRWLHSTRRTARAVAAGLRAAGFRGEITVLQWRPLHEATRVLNQWTCRYVAEGAPTGPQTDVIPARSEEGLQRPGAFQHPQPGDGLGDDRAIVAGMGRWYQAMAGCWLGAEPALRRQLILVTHRWIVESVLAPLARGERPAAGDLRPGGRLTWMLVHAIPREELDAWTRWIAVVVADLQRALTWPAARRSEEWLRWLFLIPYSIPAGGWRPAAPAEFPAAGRRPKPGA